jgi:hypothetical protein
MDLLYKSDENFLFIHASVRRVDEIFVVVSSATTQSQMLEVFAHPLFWHAIWWDSF